MGVKKWDERYIRICKYNKVFKNRKFRSANCELINTRKICKIEKNISNFQYPLKEMVVINRDSQFLEDVKSLEPYVLSELNVKSLTLSQDKHKYGITLKAKRTIEWFFSFDFFPG